MRHATLALALLLLVPARAAALQDVPASRRLVEQSLLPQLRIKGRVETHPLAERMRVHGVPAVSVAVMRGGRLEWAQAYGVRDLASGAPADTATLFQAASISKPVAALGMLRLVAAGTLALDRDVNTWLRRWKVPPSRAAQGKPVTLRQLAGHTAGTTVHGFPGYGPGDSLPSLPEILDGRKPANTDAVRVEREPGAKFEYSGGGTTIAQLAMEDATGRPFAELMAAEVLAPLGMARSTFAQPLPEARWANAATGFRPGGKPVDGRAHTYPEQAAAGLWTTPADLARMLLAVRRVVRGEERGFLPDSLARQLLARRADVPVAIGFFVEGTGDSLRFGHGGSNEGFRALMWLYLESGDGAVVMTNSDEGQRLAAEILTTVAAADAWPGFLGEEVELRPVPAATLDAYLGRWISDKLPPVTVLRRGDGLGFQLDDDDRVVTLLPLGPEDFYIAEANARVRFPGAPGRVTTMELQLPSISGTYRRAGD